MRRPLFESAAAMGPTMLCYSILLLAFWSPSSGNLVAANPSTPLPSETTISSAAPSRASLLKALTEVNDTLVASQSSQHQKSLDESRDAVAKPKQYRPFSSGGILPPQTSYVSNKTESSTPKSVKCEHTEFQCANGKCILSVLRCNVQDECGDGSDERGCNGTSDCPPDDKTCLQPGCEKGEFLCGNGKCIRAAWVCDRSNDCGDASDEINCLKNSVITAAIMGSLICGLLLVIAISCTCKLIALRQVEQAAISAESPVEARGSQAYSRSFPFAFSNEPDTLLFRMEQEFFYREPPPSYAAAVGAPITETPYDRERQTRRQRRARRHRRRPPSPPPLAEDESGDASVESTQTSHCLGAHTHSNIMSITGNSGLGGCPPSSTQHHSHHHGINDPASPFTDAPSGDKASTISANNSSLLSALNGKSPGEKEAPSPSNSNSSPETCPQESNHSLRGVDDSPRLSGDSIELDGIIPSPSQIDCDEEPLLS